MATYFAIHRGTKADVFAGWAASPEELENKIQSLIDGGKDASGTYEFYEGGFIQDPSWTFSGGGEIVHRGCTRHGAPGDWAHGRSLRCAFLYAESSTDTVSEADTGEPFPW